MASKSLFTSTRGRPLPRTDTLNEAAGRAYAFGPRHALAQYAATGCLNSTFYASAEVQLQTILDLASKVEPEFLARAAIYCRTRGHMKDVPALLCAILAARSPGLLAEVFDRVIDNPKMLRNFVQIVRSGVTGRKSLGSLPKRLVVQWLEQRSDDAIFRASVGNDPSLADIIRMVHPRPATPSRAALYAYLIGRDYDRAALPELVRYYESFKAGHVQLRDAEVPDVPMNMLTSLPLKPRHWAQIAKNGTWQMLRMNLNTFARQGAFEIPGVAEAVAKKLADAAEVARARAFPYQLMTAYTTITDSVPQVCREALQDAMEHAIHNVPTVAGTVWVFPDVSGSMQSPLTGHRKGSTTAVRCLDIAALVAAAILRKNPRAGIIPFSDGVLNVSLNPRDSVLTNAQLLASLPSGGTNCSAPLAYLNAQKAEGDLVIYISDNESWIDSSAYGRFGGGATQTLREWSTFKHRSPKAKMVCLDIQPYGSTQAPDREDILNIGGFADSVFDVISQFNSGSLTPEHWVGVIEEVQL